MDISLLIGLLAIILTCLVLMPKAISAIRARDLAGFKMQTLILLLTACFLWIIYGVHASAPALVILAILGFAVTGILLALKIQHTNSSNIDQSP